MKKIPLTILCLVTLGVAICWWFIRSSPPAQKEWIRKHTASLKTLDNDSIDSWLIFSDVDANAESFVFKDGSWIFVIFHSFHEDRNPRKYLDPKDDFIGDIALAKDSYGTVYYTLDHICGGIHVNIGEEENLENIDHFFASNLDLKWKKLKNP